MATLGPKIILPHSTSNIKKEIFSQCQYCNTITENLHRCPNCGATKTLSQNYAKSLEESLPDYFINIPEWSAESIVEFKQYWDKLLEGSPNG